MLEKVINAGRNTADVYKTNPAGAFGVSIVSILLWEVGGRKFSMWSLNKLRQSAVARAAKDQTARLFKRQDSVATTPATVAVVNGDVQGATTVAVVAGDDPDEEMREQIIRTAQTVEAAANAAKKKFED